MKKHRLILSLIALIYFSASSTFSQISGGSPIKVTTQVIPPYSPYISTYVDKPNKLILILQNTSSSVYDLKLRVKLEGDNGISISSSQNFQPSQAIHLNSYETKQIDFSNNSTRYYFDQNNVDLIGITKTQLYQNQALPEGNYRICVQALDYNTATELSDGDPVGCTSTFPISYIDPPICSQPACGSEVNSLNPQNIIFNWMPPATAQGLIKYEFTLKEVPNHLNPNDVIKKPAFPVLFNTSITSVNTLVYNAAMPKLETGKQYVWRIQVIDPNQSMQFKNNGYSEACSFTYTSGIDFSFNPNINVTTTPTTSTGGTTVSVNTGNTGYVNVPGYMNISTVSGKLLYKYSSIITMHSLKKANIVLKTKYMIKKNGQYYTPMNSVPVSYGPVEGTTLATTKTSEDGDFNFAYVSSTKFGLIKTNFSNGPAEFSDKGDLYRFAVVEICNPHSEFYWNPNFNITPTEGSVTSVGSLVSMVKDCQLEVNIKHQGEYFDEISNTSEGLAMANVYLCRKTQIQIVPNYIFPEQDGLPDHNFNKPTALNNMVIVAKGETDASGKVTFKNIVFHNNPNYTYYVYADFSKDADGFVNYYMNSPVVMNNKPESGWTVGQGHNEIYKQSIFMYASWPKISGMVIDATDNKPLSCLVKLESVYLGKNGYNMFPGIGFTPGESELQQRMTKNECSSTSDCIYNATRFRLPSTDGHFQFENLPMMIQTGNIKITGPIQKLTIIKEGYETVTIFFPNFLKMGEQAFKVISLKRGATVKGKVVDAETNKPVHASFYLLGENGGGTTTSQYTYNVYNGFSVSSESFSYPVPKKSSKQKLIFEANGYLRDTVEFIANSKDVDIGEIKMHTIKRRAMILVQDDEGKSLNGSTVTIEGVTEPCTIKDARTGAVTNTLCELSKKTIFGVAIFDFKNAGGIENNDQYYTLQITPPEGSNLVPKTITCKIPNSSTYKHITVKLEKGTCISGYVFGGKGQSLPISGAKVSLDITYTSVFNSTLYKNGMVEAITDSKGYYILRGVPMRNYKQYIRAYKPSSQYIGDSISIVTSPNQTIGNLNNPVINTQGLQNSAQNNQVNNHLLQQSDQTNCTHVNFNLTLYDGMDITKVMGFPVELYSLSPAGNNTALISGAFINMPGNHQFKSDENAKLYFSNLKIIPGSVKNSQGIPYSEPSSLPISTNNNELKIKAADLLEAKIEDKKIGVYLDKTSDGKLLGAIKGKVKIPQTNFNQTTLGFASDFYLINPTDNSMNVPVFNADSTVTEPINTPEGFNVCDENGNDMIMSAPGFMNHLSLNKNSSKYKNGDFTLNANIHTNIKDINPHDLNISINNIILKKTGEPKINSSNELTLNLQNWKLICNDWEINTNGLTLNKCLLNTGTSGISVPVSNIKVNYDYLGTNNTLVDFSDLKLAGIQSVNVTSSKKNFGLVNGGSGINTWQLSVSGDGPDNIAGLLAGLPAMNSGDAIQLKNILLRSNGDQYLVMKNHSVTLKNILKFTPNDAAPMSIQNDQFAFPGMITLNVPDPHGYSATSFYKKNGGVLDFNLINVEPIIFSQGALYHNFIEQPSLENKLFVMKGYSKEEGVFPKTGTTFYYTPDSVSIWITPGQDIPINGDQKYAQATGNTHIESGKWTTFWFEGALAGMPGISNQKVGGKTQRMKMYVDGAITCSGSSISVENVSTPFGEMSWTYDLSQSRLTGFCNVDYNQGGLGIKGGVTTVVDGGGWYFQAEGKVTIPGVGDANLLGIFGNYNHSPEALSTGLGDFKCLPADFNNKVKGFIFSAGVTRQIIPTVDYDFGIVGVKFGVDLGINARVYASFGSSSSIYGIGLLAVGKAFASGSCGATCSEVSAEAQAQVGINGEYNSGTKSFDLTGCSSVSFELEAEQCLGAFDICCGDCCASVGLGKLAIGTLVHLNSSQGIDMSLIFGDCNNQCK